MLMLRYNYDRRYYEAIKKDNNKCVEQVEGNRPQYVDPADGGNVYCLYSYSSPITTVTNKYLYDNWITSIVFSFLIVVSALMLIIFGFLLFKEQKDTDSLLPLPNSDTIQIEKKN